ncbi:pyridine nucleotide-disulfide oxidoreductase [Arthrobacter sp. MYb214]|uniref:NAD(P)/FAD-dependent oxidoreductase n=1 Tax=Micrococcaceae TaxID=1268 RepID=UPI000CFC56BA|nr:MULTISPECIES: FAD-dependent oxidoreductase [unclassified Arthrobacter]PQZ87870.1 pyridine nucleotide-disulfide oxidoreductase [Arthrobacter sp. MYb222]PRB76666.1 pyridine nucleotide-disulfide oxidoreductase [Arthrobacter sp. MYb214]
MNESILIIGAGHAGVQLAETLREHGHAGAITLVDQGAQQPYQRPPLSKDFVASAQEPEVLPLRSEDFYAQQRIELLTGARATAVDRAARTVTLSDGQQRGYDRLVFATGARNRVLSCPGAEDPRVIGLRTLQDAEILRRQLDGAQRVVVAGAGFIGLEFAASARARGIDVTVLHSAPRVLNRSVSAQLSNWFTQAHRGDGIELRLGEGVQSIDVQEDLLVQSSAGESCRADLVVYGIGVLPNIELAEASGLECENGILVDAALRTSDERVYAVGDCANVGRDGTRVRLESVQNAADQARSLARTLCGEPTAYSEIAWFWSIQGRHRLQIAGLAEPTDSSVLLGDPGSEKFSIARLRDGQLVAVESINRPADHAAARKLLARGERITEAMLAGASLKDLANAAPVAA